MCWAGPGTHCAAAAAAGGRPPARQHRGAEDGKPLCIGVGEAAAERAVAKMAAKPLPNPFAPLQEMQQEQQVFVSLSLSCSLSLALSLSLYHHTYDH